MKARCQPIVALRTARWLGVALAGVAIAGVFAARAADRMALWRIVHGQCVVDQKTNGAPAPCAFVDISGGEDNGVAILKDFNGIAQHLAIPTRRICRGAAWSGRFEALHMPTSVGCSRRKVWSAVWSMVPIFTAIG